MIEMVARVTEAMKKRRRELIHKPLERIWEDLARAAIEAALVEPAISPALDQAIQDELDHPPKSIIEGE